MKIKRCSCGGFPDVKRVGDRKDYFVCVCKNCGKIPAHLDEARCTEYGAVKVWNRRASNE